MVTVVTVITVILTFIGAFASYGLFKAMHWTGLACVLAGLAAVITMWSFVVGWNPFAPGRADPSIVLQSSKWKCSAEHTEERSTPILVGHVIVPSVTHERVCDRLERR